MNWISHACGRARRLALPAVLAAGAVMSAGLAGCAGLVGPRTVTLSESDLTLLLAHQFPMERKVLDVIDLQVNNPQLHLLPDTNRLGTEVDFSALDRLFGTRAQGHIKLDYGLRFDAADHAIHMVQVRVRDFSLVSGANNLHGAAQRVGTLVAEDMLENLPLYKMKASQAEEMDRLNLEAQSIKVTAQGLSLTIAPKAQH